ncbi:TTL-domain-containing protein, partial [Glonium stellatum]
KICAIIEYEDPYVQPLILSALSAKLSPSSYTLIDSISDLPTPSALLLQFRSYESLEFEHLLRHSETSICNAYIIRKALIRKHYLSTTITNWVTKNSGSILKKFVKPAVDLEVDYAEFLDEALVEAFELRDSFERNESKEKNEREWWILKPSMSDRGQGIRLFSTEEELVQIFEGWEADTPDSEEENEDEETTTNEDANPKMQGQTITEWGSKEKEYIVTSHLRHFIVQPYIHPPLLLSAGLGLGPPSGPRKFHIRTYVLAVGALKVFVYKPMLALFAARAYTAPWEGTNDEEGLKAHLTNTCLQETGERDGSVELFWSLPDTLPDSGAGISAIANTTGECMEPWKEKVWDQICSVTGEVFEAAARGMMVHFQPLPNAFELFGLDFLIAQEPDNHEITTYLLEVNAFPDFRQTGEALRGVVGGLFEEVVDVAIKPFFGIGVDKDGSERMRSVLDVDLGRR